MYGMTRPLLLLTALSFGVLCWAQQPDPSLSSYIDSIRAIDNHAHVMAFASADDKGYDQLRCDELPPATTLPPANLRFSPDIQAAWKALYDFSGSSASDDVLAALKARKDAARKKYGDHYHDWVLQQAGVHIVLANRVAMTPELDAHFRWVPYEDALLFPLDNTAAKSLNPDRRALFTMAEQLLKQYLQLVGVNSVPPTLDEYLAKVVTPTLERQARQGAVAIKFEAAYLRPLNFQSPGFQPSDKKSAGAIYARLAHTPDASDYTILQNYLFRYIAAEAGRLRLAVHIHTGTGCGEFFDDSGADPMLLSSALNDPALRHTNFVLLHGGSPFDRHIASLIAKPNVYADMSVLELMFSPAELARILRPWLEIMPEHVMFGTDAGSFSPGADWEETTWMGSRNARRALAIALTGMVTDGNITTARAKEIADQVLRRNALELYHLKNTQ